MAGTGMLIWARAACIVFPACVLGACAAPPPEAADQAELDQCTQSADALYQQSNLNGLARTGQNGLYFAPMPNHVFDAQRDGTLDARNNQVKDCMENGNPDAPGPGGGNMPTPHIIGTQNSQ
jgi:hypothetical protein